MVYLYVLHCFCVLRMQQDIWQPKKKDKQKDINNKWVYRFRTRLDQLASWPAVLVAAAEEEKRRPMRECACTSFIGDKNQGKKKKKKGRKFEEDEKGTKRVSSSRKNQSRNEIAAWQKKKKRKEETSGAKTLVSVAHEIFPLSCRKADLGRTATAVV